MRVFALVASAFLMATAAAAAGPFVPPVPESLTMPAVDAASTDEAPRLATDGLGHWVAVWHSNDTFAGLYGPDYDIVFARSSDNGATWTAPAPLNSNAATDTGADKTPVIATDGQGAWVVVWVSNDSLGAGLGPDDEIFWSRSFDNGQTWTAPEYINVFGTIDTFNNRSPTLATDGEGLWAVAFLVGAPGNLVVETFHVDAGPFSLVGAASIDSSPLADRPELVTDGKGHWVCVFESHNAGSPDGDVRAATSADPGAAWNASVFLNSNNAVDANADRTPHVETDRKGNWIAVWDSAPASAATPTGARDAWISRSTNNGASWSAMAQLDSGTVPATRDETQPTIGTDRDGNWIATWSSMEALGPPFDADVFFQRSTNGGQTWGDPALLSFKIGGDGQTIDDGSTLANDGNGNWVALWQSRLYSGAALVDAKILYNRFFILPDSCQPLGTIYSASAPLLVNTNAAADTRDQLGGRLATDGQGNWVAVWYATEPGPGPDPINEDIYVSRSANGGASWSTPAILNTNGRASFESDTVPSIATDGAGLWVVVWQVYGRAESDTEADIYYSRSLDNGATWSAEALVNANGDVDPKPSPELAVLHFDDRDPSIATDRLGHWVVVWNIIEQTSSNARIVASQGNAGATTWSGGSIVSPSPVNNDPLAQPRVETDGRGNWLAIWSSKDSLEDTIGTDSDILVSKSTDNGGTWGAASVVNRDAALDSGNQLAPSIVTDGHGAWLALWTQGIAPFQTFFATSSDIGATWSHFGWLRKGTIPLTRASGGVVATDGGGNWFAAMDSAYNPADEADTDPDPYVARSPDGGRSWGMGAPLFSNLTSDADVDLIADFRTDGNGTWLVLMSRRVTDDLDVYVSRFTLKNAAEPGWAEYR